MIRATSEEKELQIHNLNALHETHADVSQAALETLQQAAINHDNVFEQLIEAVKYCSLGQITDALFEVGGQYRQSM